MNYTYYELLEEEIYILEKKQYKMENDIRELWDNVMVPYMNNYNNNILSELTDRDYYKFYEFMIDNNEVYNEIFYKLEYLRSLMDNN